MGMTAGASGGQSAVINVTPLIDVLLVLLIIFMVITPLTPKGLDALVPQPPPPNAPKNNTPDRTIVVQLIDRGAEGFSQDGEIDLQAVMAFQGPAGHEAQTGIAPPGASTSMENGGSTTNRYLTHSLSAAPCSRRVPRDPGSRDPGSI